MAQHGLVVKVRLEVDTIDLNPARSSGWRSLDARHSTKAISGWLVVLACDRLAVAFRFAILLNPRESIAFADIALGEAIAERPINIEGVPSKKIRVTIAFVEGWVFCRTCDGTAHGVIHGGTFHVTSTAGSIFGFDKRDTGAILSFLAGLDTAV